MKNEKFRKRFAF